MAMIMDSTLIPDQKPILDLLKIKKERRLYDKWQFSTITTTDVSVDLKECSVVLSDCRAQLSPPSPEPVVVKQPTPAADRSTSSSRHRKPARSKSGTDKSSRQIRRYKLGITKSCRICQRSFTHATQLSAHLASCHATEAPFWCRLCHRPVQTTRAFQYHNCLLPSQLSDPLCCRFCLLNFPSPNELLSHLPSHPPPKRYLCTVCGQTYLRRFQLKLHDQASHRAERPHHCSVCDKGFNQANHLVVHMRVHTRERPYRCEICGKAYTQQFSLNRHRRVVHTGELPCVCPQCPRRYAYPCLLRVHMAVHGGEKRYQCPQCPKRFLRSNNLTTHMRVHSGLRPYQCQICKQCYPHSSQLTAHVRSHTGERRHRCHLCPKAYFIPKYLRMHLKRVHEDEVEAPVVEV